MKTSPKLTALALFLIVFSIRSTAQIGGPFNVPNDFPTIAAAINTLNILGVAQAVTINVTAGHTETATAGGYTLYNVPGASATNSIVFQKSGIGPNPLIVAQTGIALPISSPQDVVWRLVGADYITIDGLDILDPNISGASMMEAAYALHGAGSTNGCSYNVIKNCVISLNRTNFSKGIESGLVNPSVPAGSNSYNKFYSNTIQNCHIGILLSGTTINGLTLKDTRNEIGGSSPALGNTIINYGGGVTNGTPEAIRAEDQHSLTIYNNVINNNNGSGVDHPYHLSGIEINSTASLKVAVRHNTISLRSSATSTIQLNGIINDAEGNDIFISRNVFANYNYTTSGSAGPLLAPSCTLICNRLGYFSPHIDSNYISNVAVGSGTFQMISSANGIQCSISSNTITSVSGNNAGSFYLIRYTADDYPIIKNNLIENISWINTNANTNSIYCIHGSSTRYNATFNNNVIRNISVGGSGSVKGIVELSLTGSKIVQGNQIYNLYTVSGGYGGTEFKGIDLTTSGNYTAIVNSNAVYSIAVTSTLVPNLSGGAIGGIYCTSNGRVSIHNNKVHSFSVTSQNGNIAGISATTNTLTAYNNVIGDFFVPNAGGGQFMTGFYIGNGISNLYYNSIHLNTPNSGLNFGSSALWHAGTGTLSLNNNILVNTSTCNGTELTVAFRRTSTSLGTYSTSSNNNVFYAGTPTASNVLYFQGTATTYSTLAGFKTLVTPRESQSKYENPAFISTSGSSPAFLNINPTFPTQIEGGALPIPGYTADYAGTARNTVTPDIGAFEGNYTQADVNPPLILSSGFVTDACNLNTRTYTVNISDATGVATGSLAPRLYYKRNFGLYTSTQGNLTSGTVNNGIWTFTLNYSANVADVISYFLAAQDQSFLSNLTIVPSAGSSATDVNSVLIPPSPANSYTISTVPGVSVSSGSVCSGKSFTLVPTGVVSYTITGGSAVVSPTVNSSYSVTGSNAAGCTSSNIAVADVTVQPSPTLSVNSGSICSGQTFTILPMGGINYTYSPGSNLVSPSNSNSYTVTGDNSIGCTSSVISSVTVYATPTIAVNSGSICLNKSFTITPSGASSYSITGSSFIVSPSTNTLYTVTGTSSAGCTSTAGAVSNITVAPLPTVSVNSGTVCTGKNFTMVPSGASTYTYSSGTSIVSPLTNTFYNVTGTSSVGCISSNTAVATVTVYTTPTISVNSGSICSGQTFTMSPTGASTYSYFGNSATVSPPATTSYSVSGTSSLGCISGSVASNVTVQITPTISVNSGSICAAKIFTMVPSGATSYVFSSGTNTVSPATNSFYTVVGTSTAGCVSNTATSNVTVAPLPTVSVNSGTVCSSRNFTLVGSGASTYTYSSGTTIVAPTTNTFYTVTGTSSVGCVSSNTGTATLTVFATPTITVNSGTICSGQTFSIIANGAASYSYAGNSATVSPSATTSYSVSGTSTAGCVSNSVATNVTVNITPTVSINSGSICAGSIFTFTPSGANSYTITGNSMTVSPSADAGYTLTGQSAEGCLSSNTVVSTVSVVALPTISVNSGSMCVGSVFTLSPTGASSYTYSGNSATVSPANTSTYSVTGFNNAGCSSFNSPVATVTVYSLPAVSISGPSIICMGSTITLNAGGASTYSWNAVTPGTSLIISPIATSTYTLLGVDANGCVNTAQKTVTVNPLPSFSITGNASVCSGTLTSLLINGNAITYTWNTGATGNLLSLTPTISAVYTATGTSANSCVSTATISLVVNNLPPVTANSNTNSVCAGNQVTLFGSGALSYTWTNSVNDNTPFSPINTATYTVTGTDANSCKNSATIEVVVLPLPTVNILNSSDTICAGETVTLTATGADSYNWNTADIVPEIMVNPDTLTEYSVIGTDLNGCSSASAVFTLEVSECVGIESSNLNYGISLYPNPADNELTVTVKDLNKNLRLEIFNSLSQLIYSSELTLSESKINLRELAKGIYFVKVYHGSRLVSNEKVVKTE